MLVPLNTLSFPIQYLEVCDSLIRAHDGDLAEFHRHCRVSTADLLDIKTLINGEQLLAAFTFAQRYCDPHQSAVLQILVHFPLTAHGMLGMLALASRTLGDAVNAAIEFFPLVMPAFRVSRQNISDQVKLVFERRTDFGDQNDFFTELVMSVLHKIMAFIQIPIPEVQVYFSHAATASFDLVSAYQAVIPAQIHFAAKHNCIVLPRASLDIAITTQSPTLHHMLEAELRERSQRAEHLRPISQRVKRLIKLYLDEGRVIHGDLIADGLHLSRRTLTRRLAEEGSQLPTLYNEVCVDYAVSLLRSSDKSIAEIAHKAGFSNAANFSRTFKRMTGKTPSQLRAELE